MERKPFKKNKMIRKKLYYMLCAALASVLLLTALAGCGRNEAAAKATEPASNAGPVSTTAPSGPPEAEAKPGRQNGERFEDVIILEWMEETVRYEHVRNDTIGFEMDYDYELFARRSESDRERFVSVWDDAANPENYLEVTRSSEAAETVAAAVSEALSRDYEISRDDSFMLNRAGSCIRMDASADVGGLTMPEHLQMVYIIPAPDGCRVATAHYAIEGAEGFGRRFRYMMDTFSAVAAQGEKRLTDEQAVSAIQRYCYISDPDLEGVVSTGEHLVYWAVSSSDENEIVVVFRSYTGSLNRYYMNPISGDTYVTEFVPGIMDEEQRTDESLNAWDYLN